MNIEKTMARAIKEIDKNRYWRAKEILLSANRSIDFSVDFYELVGRVLLEMKDDIRAGLFLFLSGRSNDQYSAPIEQFLYRYRNLSGSAFYAIFPENARLTSLRAYPSSIQSTLEELGFPSELVDKCGYRNVEEIRQRRIDRKEAIKKSWSKENEWQVVASIVFFLVLAFLGVGAYTSIGFVIDLFLK